MAIPAETDRVSFVAGTPLRVDSTLSHRSQPTFAMLRSCLLLLGCAATAAAQSPVIDRTQSSSLSPGADATVTVYGSNLKDVQALWTPVGRLPVQPAAKPSDKIVQFAGSIPSDVLPGVYPGRVLTKHGVSGPTYLVVDDLPTFAPPKNDPEGSVCPIPCCIEGTVTALQQNQFTLQLRRGQRLSVEVWARRLNSALDPVVRLTDENGNEVAFADDHAGLAGDAALSFTASADGRYTLFLRDVRFGGGGRHFFHLRMGSFEPVCTAFPRRAAVDQDVRLLGLYADIALPALVAAADRRTLPATASADSVTSFAQVVRTPVTTSIEEEPNDQPSQATMLAADTSAVAGRFQRADDVDWFGLPGRKGQTLAIRAHTRSVGAPSDVILRLHDSSGKNLAESDDAGASDAQIVFTPTSDAPLLLSVHELTGSYGPAWTYDLQVEFSGTVDLSTAVDVLSVPPNHCAALKVDVQRLGFGKPFVLRAAGAPEGFVIPDVVVGPRQKSAFLTITTRSASDVFHHPLKFEAVLEDSGRTVPVSIRPPVKKGDLPPPHNPVRSKVFLFAGASPTPFAPKPDQTTLSAAAGSTVKVQIRANRTGDQKPPIKIESAVPADELPKGLTVQPASITEETTELGIQTSDQLPAGRYTLSLQGTVKIEKKTLVQPVPSIDLIVTAPDPAP